MAITQSVLTLTLSVFFVIILGVKGTIIAQYIAMFVTIRIGYSFVKSDLRDVDRIKLSREQLKPFFIMGISLMVANLFSMMMQYNEMFLVNNLIKSETITANYKVAMLIPSQLSILTGSIVVYFFPIIARINDLTEVWKKTVKIGVFTLLIILSITVLGVLLGPFIIQYVYGESYSDAIQLSYIFWIVYGINAGFRMLPLNILPAIGIVKFNTIISVVSAVCHILLSYYFISNFGVMGAAYAIGIIYFISGILYWVYLYKLTHKHV